MSKKDSVSYDNLVLATVKWFGGYNNRTGRPNDFGFAEAVEGYDIFIHKTVAKIELSEGQIVLLRVEKGERGFSATECVTNPVENHLDVLLSALPEENSERRKEIRRSILGNIASNLNPEQLKPLDSNAVIDLLNKIYDAEVQYRRHENPWVSRGSLGGKIPKLVEILNSSISKSGPSSLEQNLQEYLLSLPLVIITKLQHFDELIKQVRFREVFETFYLEREITSLNEAVNLIRKEIREPKDFFDNPDIVIEMIDSVDLDEPNDIAKIFVKNLIEYLSSCNHEELCVFLEDVSSYRVPESFIESIITPERIEEALEKGKDFTVFPSHIISANVDIIEPFVRSNIKSESIEPLFAYLPADSVIDIYFSHEMMNKSILKRSDVREKIIEFVNDLEGEQVPDAIKPFLISPNETDSRRITEYFKSSTVPKYFKKLLGRKIAMELLYKKEASAQWIYERGFAGPKNIKTFILFNLLPLLIKNPPDTAFAVFKHRIWEYLEETKIDLDDSLMELFPSCHTIDWDKSCEAVFWEKHDMFLCRGKPCHDPQVIPDTDKHYQEYSIYDWLKHYGIDYLVPGKPNNADFAHKLAGYFNRLKEIADILFCRECSKVLVPNFKYARTEYYEFDFKEKKYVKKSMAAAYRVTVFRCEKSSCSEYEEDIYINHCIGWNCGNVIDSRDLPIQCSRGFYVCDSCCACCEPHLQEYPPGICPKCGSPVIVWEKEGDRFVYCSNKECEFKITTKNLPKRFTLPSMPVQHPGQYRPVQGHQGNRGGSREKRGIGNSEDPPLSIYDDMYDEKPNGEEWGEDYSDDSGGGNDDEPLPF